MNLTSLALLLLALICSPVASYAGNKCSPNGMSASMWKEGPDQFDVYQSKGAENEVIATWNKAQAEEISCTLTRGKTGTLVAVYGRHDSSKKQCDLLAKKINTSSHPCAREAVKILIR